MAMHKYIKDLWVQALRSGELKQGTGQLSHANNDHQRSFCCLGVLCNIHAQMHPQIAAKQTNPECYLGQTGLPSKAVMKWAGLSSTDPRVTIDGNNTYLSYHNDGMTRGSQKRTFLEIADAIEAQL